jgi:cyclopropane fatty-acyl-phospholipid synthase-like methyltransferase
VINFRPLAYKHLTFNTPLSEVHAAALIERCGPVGNILDLGCGWGELLLRSLAANPIATGLGVDNDPNVLDRGRGQAIELGVQNRVEFRNADATTVQGRYDLVIAIGATHVWGKEADALSFFRERLDPGGKVLFGTGMYTTTPAPEIKEIFGELPGFDELQDIIRRNGFNILDAEEATIEEWDAFEANWRKGLEASADAEIQAFAHARKKEYEEGYRSVLGFCYIVATYA